MLHATSISSILHYHIVPPYESGCLLTFIEDALVKNTDVIDLHPCELTGPRECRELCDHLLIKGGYAVTVAKFGSWRLDVKAKRTF